MLFCLELFITQEQMLTFYFVKLELSSKNGGNLSVDNCILTVVCILMCLPVSRDYLLNAHSECCS